HQAGLRHRGPQRMEAVETAAIRDQFGPLLFEDLPDRLVRPFGMGMRFGPGQTLIEEPGVQLVIALDAQARGEEALAHEADLVLDLALLPARRRRAGDRLDKMVRAHLEEAAIVLPILAVLSRCGGTSDGMACAHDAGSDYRAAQTGIRRDPRTHRHWGVCLPDLRRPCRQRRSRGPDGGSGRPP